MNRTQAPLPDRPRPRAEGAAACGWPRWLDKAGVASYLSCPKGRVAGLVEAGKLPPLGSRSPRFDRERIDSLMHGRQVADDMDAAIERANAAAYAKPTRKRARKMTAGGR